MSMESSGIVHGGPEACGFQRAKILFSQLGSNLAGVFFFRFNRLSWESFDSRGRSMEMALSGSFLVLITIRR
jgi:hypothetical protein